MKRNLTELRQELEQASNKLASYIAELDSVYSNVEIPHELSRRDYPALLQRFDKIKAYVHMIIRTIPEIQYLEGLRDDHTETT